MRWMLNDVENRGRCDGCADGYLGKCNFAWAASGYECRTVSFQLDGSRSSTASPTCSVLRTGICSVQVRKSRNGAIESGKDKGAQKT
jgi:hypothetical protein